MRDVYLLRINRLCLWGRICVWRGCGFADFILKAMKKTLVLIISAIACCACTQYDFTTEDWVLLYPEMNAHLKVLSIDAEGFEHECNDFWGELYLEYLPNALKVLDEYISDEMDSYQDMAVLPDLSDRIGEDLNDELSFVSGLSESFLGISPANECMTRLCDYVRNEFNSYEDFALMFPDYVSRDKNILYYTTYCIDTGEYYLILKDEVTGELSYRLQAVNPEALRQ